MVKGKCTLKNVNAKVISSQFLLGCIQSIFTEYILTFLSMCNRSECTLNVHICLPLHFLKVIFTFACMHP